ncbi:peptidoglycan glycosyltransferase [Conyzicola nivalis]|uniref:Peptidoglycan glycosyltransferase n=1 Tax=Conyzicola nivalis TaxID=1477021 RepID=A0ABV2QT76_9MICO
MNKELKRVSIVVLLMFVALFTSSSVIQVVAADELRADARNTRTTLDSFSTKRGPILVDGVPIAQSDPVDGDVPYQRVYSNGPLYAPVTGYFTLNQGTTGIEGALNDTLSGTSNAQFFDQINRLFTGATPTGDAVELTIDGGLQQVAWDALGENAGSVVALDPKTGAILAMVSKPSFDPNLLAVHNTPQVLETYDALTADPAKPLANRAIAGDLYTPGSVFKLVVASAALASGSYTADSEFPNPPSLTLPGSSSVITNSEGGACGGAPTVTIATAFRLSCNIPFAELGLALGYDAIEKQAALFGFGSSMDVPMSTTPSVYPQTESDAQLMLSSFGQASVRVTPLQIAMVSAAIANDGALMQPTLIESILAPDLTVKETLQPTVYNTPMTSETAETMTQMMTSAVSNGVGGNARISGVNVAGKTGTAETGPGEPYTLWFTGFAPAEDPEVVVAVVVENGGGLGQSGFGNSVAAPIAKKVLEAVLNK